MCLSRRCPYLCSCLSSVCLSLNTSFVRILVSSFLDPRVPWQWVYYCTKLILHNSCSTTSQDKMCTVAQLHTILRVSDSSLNQSNDETMPRQMPLDFSHHRTVDWWKLMFLCWAMGIREGRKVTCDCLWPNKEAFHPPKASLMWHLVDMSKQAYAQTQTLWQRSQWPFKLDWT